MKIVNDNEIIPNILHTKISWNNYCQYTDLENTQSTAFYVIKSIKPHVSHVMLITIYYFLVHSIMTYCLILWRSSSDSCKIFRMQKRVSKLLWNTEVETFVRIYSTNGKLYHLVTGHIFSTPICS